jgi:hypothetical protein
MLQKSASVTTEETGPKAETFAARFFWAIAALILLLGLLFRLPGLGDRSLWIDELYSQWFSSRSFAELWRDVPLFEPHPPVYYSLLKLWSSVFGNSELGLRSLSLVASLATILVTAMSGRLIKAGGMGEGVGLLGAALLAVNFANIREAQNARPYAIQGLLLTMAVIAALVLVTRLLRQVKAHEATGGWLAPALVLGISAGAALWIHNTSLFIAFGIWCGLTLSLIATPAGQRQRNFGIFFVAGILALLVWAPDIQLFLRQSRAFADLPFWLTPKPRDLYSAWLLLIGDNWLAFPLALILLAIGFVALARRSPALALTVATILLVPLYVMLAISFSVKPIYIQRLFAWMVPLTLLVIALGILTLTRRRWIAAALALLTFATAATASIRDFSRPIDDWKAIVAEIARNAQPDDVVIGVAAEGSIAVSYYAGRQPHFPPLVCIPGCYPQRNLPRPYGSNFGAPKVIEADAALVDQALKTHGRVWLVQVSVALYDPNGIVRKEIAARRTFVRYYGNSLAKVELFE